MYKTLTLLAMLFLSVGCTQKATVPKLTMGTTEVFYTDVPDKDMYPDEETRTKATTMVQVSLTNPGDKKLVFIIDQEILWPKFWYEKQWLGLMRMEIIDPNNTHVKARMPIHSMPVKEVNQNCTDYTNIYLKALKKYKKLDVEMRNVMDVYNFVNHGIVLLPGETKSFYLEVTLPIIKEYVAECSSMSIYYDSIPDNSRFRLRYDCDAKALKAALPQYLKEELDRNGYEIFDGEIVTESIPLKKR